jgi:hypothetical protein
MADSLRDAAAALPLPHSFRLGLTNDRRVPLILQLEPWAYDYTAASGQRLELILQAALPDAWINVVYNDDDTVQVYVEGEGPQHGVAWDVFLDGVPIDIGHNRELWSQTSRPPV